MRTRSQEIFRQLERRDGLLALHGGEVVEELMERVAGGKVVNEVLYRHPRSSEDRGPPENLWIDLNDGF